MKFYLFKKNVNTIDNVNDIIPRGWKHVYSNGVTKTKHFQTPVWLDWIVKTIFIIGVTHLIFNYIKK